MINHEQIIESEATNIRPRSGSKSVSGPPPGYGPVTSSSSSSMMNGSPHSFEFLPQARFPAQQQQPSNQMPNNRPGSGSYSPSFTPSQSYYTSNSYSFSPVTRPNGHGKQPQQHPTVTTHDSGMTYYHEPPQRNHRMHHQPPFNEVIRNQAHMNGYNMSKSHIDAETAVKPKRTFFIDDDLRNTLLTRQMACHMSYVDSVNPSQFPDEVEQLYHQLFPLEQTDHKSMTFSPIQVSTFRVNRRDGLQFCMKRIHDCRNISQVGIHNLEKWRNIRHSNIVRLHEVFSSKAFGDQSLLFVYDFHPCSDTLMDELFRVPSWRNKPDRQKKMISEPVLWTYIVQLTSALRQIHTLGLAYRAMDLTKIIKSGPNRIRLSSIGIKDLLAGSQDDMQNLNRHQQEDLINLGHVLLSIASNMLSLPHNTESIGKALDIVQKNFSKDLHQVIIYLIFGPNSSGQIRNRSINELMPMIGARFYTIIDDVLLRGDRIEDELSTTLENGRLFKLMCKLGAVERNTTAASYETGDRYLLKLYRDHLFRQTSDSGTPWLDMSHIVQSLNKLDIGSSERFLLTSHDNQNVLVVSYSDMKKATSKCFAEIVNQSHL